MKHERHCVSFTRLEALTYKLPPRLASKSCRDHRIVASISLPLSFSRRTTCLVANVARAQSEARAFLGSEASEASFSKNPRERSISKASIIYIYI
jgi:hypothetical protein